jgi:hypothetical protein
MFEYRAWKTIFVINRGNFKTLIPTAFTALRDGFLAWLQRVSYTLSAPLVALAGGVLAVGR